MTAPEPDPLVVFLRDRIDEDVAVASAADPGPWGFVPDPADSHFGDVVSQLDQVTLNRTGEGTVTAEDAAHIARHDPVRVLADATAKTAVLDLHAKVHVPSSAILGHATDCACAEHYACEVCIVLDPDGYDQGDWPCRSLLLLAQPYRIGPDGTQRPDWRDEWNEWKVG